MELMEGHICTLLTCNAMDGHGGSCVFQFTGGVCQLAIHCRLTWASSWRCKISEGHSEVESDCVWQDFYAFHCFGGAPPVSQLSRANIDGTCARDLAPPLLLPPKQQAPLTDVW